MNNIQRYLSALRYLQGHIEAKGFVPRTREAASALGISEDKACRLFATLRENGLAQRDCYHGFAPYPTVTTPIPRDPDGHPLYWIPLP